MANPGLLAGLTPARLKALLGNLPSDWEEGVLKEGTFKGLGWALRELKGEGLSGRSIRYHPPGWRHGPFSYWRVTGLHGGSGVSPIIHGGEAL